MTELAVIVPVFNNLKTLDHMDRELTEALEGLQLDWQVIWVDDASTDGSWVWIRTRCRQDPRHRGIRLARNCGQSLAVCTGVAEAPVGAVVVTFDADLEYATDDIGGMVAACSGPRVFVAGTRTRTNGRGWTSSLFNLVTRLLTGDRTGDVGCGFMAIGPDLAGATDRAGGRALALRPFLSTHASATVRREVGYAPTGNSTTGGRLRARIAFDLLASDPRPALRLSLAAAALVGMSATTRWLRVARTAGVLAAATAITLKIRWMVLRTAFRHDPPTVAESAPPSPGTTEALANRSTTGHPRAQ